MSLRNYWNLSTEEQEKVKTNNPDLPPVTWQVKGRLNIQTRNSDGFLFASSKDVNTTIQATAASEAALKVVQGLAVYFPAGTTAAWLNDGPEVEVIK